MKAIFIKKTGTFENLKFIDIKKPIPKDNEILIKVYASTVTRGDVILRKIPRIVLAPIGFLFGFKSMYIPGVEFSGIVESFGKCVKSYKPGDSVFGTTTGLKYGGNAEYLVVPENGKLNVLGKKPKSLTFPEAAATPVGGMTALQLLSKIKIKKGCSILIYGASGSVGTNVIQISNIYNAQVTAVCSSSNFSMVKSIGAKFVIDYTKESFINNNLKYDIIFDAVGKISKSYCKNSLKSGGSFVSIKSPTKETISDLETLINFSEEGIIKPVIDRTYDLEDVPKAHKYVEKGHKKGNVVIVLQNFN